MASYTCLARLEKILYSTINKLDRFITAFERNPKFWMEHDLSPIPEELLIRIGDLGRYEIVHCKNLLSYLDSFTAKSQWVKAVSAFPIPAKNAEVVEKSGIVCVTTDRGVVLGLRLLNGVFDLSKAVFSCEEGAIEWGKDVFITLCKTCRTHLQSR